MKRKLFQIASVLLLTFLSATTFAQPEAPGDSGEGSGDPISFTFKRNNGNGTAGGEAEIRVYFSVLPVHLPSITAIEYEGQSIAGLVVSAIDVSPFKKKGYVSYCIRSSNLLPAKKLSIRFYNQITRHEIRLTQDESL